MPERGNILYIPGLGGNISNHAQRTYLGLLNIFGHGLIYFDTQWPTAEKYETKYQRLNDFFEEKGKPKTIYANSAGASLALRLTIEHADEIKTCHLVCGKVYGAHKIGSEYSERGPALQHAAAWCDTNAANIEAGIAEKITCYVPEGVKDDGVIEVVDMIVPNSKTVNLPNLPHASAIIYAGRHYLPKL